MTIRYSGTAYRVTSSLVDAVARLGEGLEPEADPIPAGTIEVAGLQDDINDGAFAVTVSDRPDVFEPYRLKATERVLDPCADERSWLRLMQSQLEVARREGLSTRVLRGLGEQVTEAHQRLNDCVERNALAGAAPRPLIFRSLDMYRTGNTEEDNLRIYIRALDSADWQSLQTFGLTRTERIPYHTLRAEIEQQLPAGFKVDLVSRVNANTIRLDIRTVKFTFSVRGHINIILEPSLGSNFRSFLRVTRSEVDFHGFVGGIAGLAVGEEKMADQAVDSFEHVFNNDIATQLQHSLFERGGTLTIDDIVTERDGIRIFAQIGLLVGGRQDPCQDLRNLVLVQEREVAVALREGLSRQAIAQHREHLRLRRQAVDECRARN